MAGGISSTDGVLKTVIKECKEEAGIPEKLSSTARPAGTLRYGYFISFNIFCCCSFLTSE